MSQGSLNVPTTGPVSPTVFAGDINTAVDALVSKNSGASSPTNFPTTGGGPTQFQEWVDTTVAATVLANIYDGASWTYTATLDTTNHVWKPKLHAGTAIGIVSLTVNVNNWNPSRGNSNRVPVTASAPLNVTGLVAGNDGDIVIIEVQAGSSAITFTASDTNSTAANRFLMPQALIAAANQSVEFYYSSALSRWRAITQTNSPGMTVQNLTSGVAATYTTPAGCTFIKVRAVGGGGGGGGTAAAAGTGGTTSFNSVTALGGTGGANFVGASGGAGGTGGTGGAGSATRFPGGNGGDGGFSSNSSSGNGGEGGVSPFGGSAPSSNTNGHSAAVNSGSGGSGVGNGGAGSGGGAAGEYFELIINSPAATYTYTIGAAGTPATNGGNGGSGRIIVEEFYS